jgi:hypothetical protein
MLRIFRTTRLWSCIATVVAAGTIAACAMVESEPLMKVGGYQCESHAGAYFLPKSQIQLDVIRVGASEADTVYNLEMRVDQEVQGHACTWRGVDRRH